MHPGQLKPDDLKLRSYRKIQQSQQFFDDNTCFCVLSTYSNKRTEILRRRTHRKIYHDFSVNLDI